MGQPIAYLEEEVECPSCLHQFITTLTIESQYQRESEVICIKCGTEFLVPIEYRRREMGPPIPQWPGPKGQINGPDVIEKSDAKAASICGKCSTLLIDGDCPVCGQIGKEDIEQSFRAPKPKRKKTYWYFTVAVVIIIVLAVLLAMVPDDVQTGFLSIEEFDFPSIPPGNYIPVTITLKCTGTSVAYADRTEIEIVGVGIEYLRVNWPENIEGSKTSTHTFRVILVGDYQFIYLSASVYYDGELEDSR